MIGPAVADIVVRHHDGHMAAPPQFFGWRDQEEAFTGYLPPYFEALQQFFSHAAAANQQVLAFFSQGVQAKSVLAG